MARKDDFDLSPAENERLAQHGGLRVPSGTYEVPTLAVDEAAKGSRGPLSVGPSAAEMEAARRTATRRRALYRRAFISLVLFTVAVPILVVAGLTWHSRLNRSMEDFEKAETARALDQSVILKIMRAPRPARDAGATEVGVLLILSDPPDAEVIVNGVPVKSRTPVRLHNVEAGIPLEVRVLKRGYEEALHLLSLSSGEEKEIRVRLDARR